MKLLKTTPLVDPVLKVTVPAPPPVIERLLNVFAVATEAVAPKFRLLEVALTSVTPNRAAVPWVIVIPVEVSVFQIVPVPERFSVQLPKFRVLVLPFDDANTPTVCTKPALSVKPSR